MDFDLSGFKPKPIEQEVKPITVDSTDNSIDLSGFKPKQNNTENVQEGKTYPIDVKKYDPYLTTTRPDKGLDVIDRERADAQPWTEQGLNAVKQIVGDQIIGGTAKALGAIFELPSAIYDETTGKDADFSNFMTDLGDNISEYVKDKSPIYQKYPNEHFTVKNLSDSGWWFGNIPSVASALSMLVPALTLEVGGEMALSRLGKLVGATEELNAARLAKAESTINELSQLGTLTGDQEASFNTAQRVLQFNKLGAQAKYWSKLTSSAVVMRQAENFMEALQTYQQGKKDMLSSLYKEDGKYEELLNSELGKKLQEQGRLGDDIDLNKEAMATYAASQAGWKTYQLNAINVLFDMVQLAPLIKGLPIHTRTNGFFGIEKEVEKELINQGLRPNLTTAQKALRFFAKPSNAILSSASEGIEEMINGTSQNEGQYILDRYLGKQDKSTWTERYGNYLKDGNVLEQGFWGLLGGLAFEQVGHPAWSKATELATGNKQANIAEIKLQELMNRAANQGAYMKEIGEIKSDLDDKKITPSEAKNRYHEAQSKWDTIIGLAAAKAGNVDLVEEQLNHPDFQKQIYGSYTPEQLKEIGIDNVSRAVAQSINNIRNTERYYNEARNNFFTSNLDERVKDYLIDTHTMTSMDNERLVRKNTKLINDSIELEKEDYYLNNTQDTNVANTIRLRSLETAINIAESEIEKSKATYGDKDKNIRFLAQKKLNVLKEERDRLDKELGNDKASLSSLNPKIISNKVAQIYNELRMSANKEGIKSLESPTLQKNVKESIENATKNSKDKLFNDYKKSINDKLVKNEIGLKELENAIQSETDEDRKKFLQSKIDEINNATEVENRRKAQEEENKKRLAEEREKKVNELTNKKSEKNYKPNPLLASILQGNDLEELEGYRDLFDPENPATHDSIAKSIGDAKAVQKRIDQIKGKENKPEKPKETATTKKESPKEITVESTSEQYNGIASTSANLFLTLSPTNKITVESGNDLKVKTEFDDSVKAIMKLQEGDEVYLEVDNDLKSTNEKYNSEDTQPILVKDSNGTKIGYINDTQTLIGIIKDLNRIISLPLEELEKEKKSKFVEWRLKELKGEMSPADRSLQSFKDTIEQNLFATKAIRKSIASFPDNKKTRIDWKSAGSIIKSKELRNPREILDKDTNYFMVAEGNTQVLTNVKNENEVFSRNTTGIFTNLDAAYTEGLIYNLVPVANSVKGNISTYIPVPITIKSVSKEIANDITDKILDTIKIMQDGTTIESEDIRDLKSTLSKYVILRETDEDGKGLRIYVDEAKGGRIEFDTPEGKVIVNARGVKNDEEGNLIPTDTHNMTITTEQGTTIVGGKDKDFYNKLSTQIQTLRRNINTKALGENKPFGAYASYEKFLDDTNAWGTDLGALYSSEGNKLGYVTNDNNGAALNVSISTNLEKDSSISNTKQEVSDIFKESSQLAKIGSEQEYSEYINSIFPDSKVKDIVYHGTEFEFNKFDKEAVSLRGEGGWVTNFEGFHFATDLKTAESPSLNKGLGNRKILRILLNSKSVKEVKDSPHAAFSMEYWDSEIRNAKKNKFDTLKYINEYEGNDINYVVFEPEQIHILGNKSDIEGFKQWKENNKSIRYSQKEVEDKMKECLGNSIEDIL